MKNYRRSENDAEELAFFGFNKFKERCGFCGKIGHKAANCCEKKKNLKKPPFQNNGEKKGNFVPTYHHCGEVGHIRPKCPKLHKKHSFNKAFSAVEETAFQATESDSWIPVAKKKSFSCKKKRA